MLLYEATRSSQLIFWSLLETYKGLISRLSNTAAFINERMKGVCGTALAEDRTVIIPDVTGFSGYISCDAAAKSEVVLPLHDSSGKVAAVLDIDSSTTGRFKDTGAAGEEIRVLEEAAEYILAEVNSQLTCI